jgi:two-component system, NarL family, response regulator DevR
MDGSPAATVFLLAQNRLVREALTKVLDRKSDVAVVGSQALSPQTTEDVIAAAPDVLVVDSYTASTPHLELLRQVQGCVSDVRVVMIGMDPDEQHFLQAVRDGATWYVLKDASALEVVAAVRAVAAGDAVCPLQLCASLFRYIAKQNQLPSFRARATLGLTNREQQLIALIGRGMTNKEIACQLNLAEQTVRNHVHRILRKIGASDRFTVVEMCRMQGMAV